MSFTKQYNKGRKFLFDTTNFEYHTLESLFNENGVEKIYPLTALYINTKSKYGDNPVFATNEYFVNAPSHMLDTVNNILEDDEAIELINNGKVGFTIYTYEMAKYKRTCYGINFVDIH